MYHYNVDFTLSTHFKPYNWDICQSICFFKSYLFTVVFSCCIQARAGEASTVDFLKVAQAFVNETNYTVWSDLLNGLATLSTLMQYTDYHANYLTYNCRLLADIAKNLGWDPVKGESKKQGVSKCYI